MGSFINRTSHQMLLEPSNKGRWERLGMWHA